MQVVRKIREKYSAPYLNVVSVSLDTDEKAWREILHSDTLEGWAHCILKEGWNANQVENLGIQSLPATFVLNGTGRIVAKNIYDEELIDTVDKTVAEVGEDKTFGEKSSSSPKSSSKK